MRLYKKVFSGVQSWIKVRGFKNIIFFVPPPLYLLQIYLEREVFVTPFDEKGGILLRVFFVLRLFKIDLVQYSVYLHL